MDSPAMFNRRHVQSTQQEVSAHLGEQLADEGERRGEVLILQVQRRQPRLDALPQEGALLRRRPLHLLPAHGQLRKDHRKASERLLDPDNLFDIWGCRPLSVRFSAVAHSNTRTHPLASERARHRWSQPDRCSGCRR